jgi:hypothetical protein
MKTIKLGALGDKTPRPCNSLALVFEIVTAWTETPDKTQLGYLCAAAIISSIDASDAPKYNPTKSDIKGFGRDCVEFLLGKGVAIPDIYSFGSLLLSKMVAQLPTSQGADEAANFSSAPDADSSNI